jgi:hypothetical protein
MAETAGTRRHLMMGEDQDPACRSLWNLGKLRGMEPHDPSWEMVSDDSFRISEGLEDPRRRRQKEVDRSFGLVHTRLTSQLRLELQAWQLKASQPKGK